MKDVREEIRGWITECCEDVEQEGGLTAILLVHFDGRGMENEIFSMKASSAKWGRPNEMCDVVYRFSQRHAAGYTGAQQFRLSAVFGSSGTATRFLPFGLQGVLSYGPIPGGGGSEPPTPTGQLQQGMRLTELLVQGAFGQNARNADTQERLIEKLMRRQQELEAECRELWAALKLVLMELQKDKHADKMKELMAVRMTEFGKHLIKLAPALINMMADREVFPLSSSDTGILDTIAEFSSAEDLRQMQAVLALKGESGQQIAIALTNRFEQYHRRKAEELAAEKRAVAGLPSRAYEEAEQDAMGEAIRVLRGKANGASPSSEALKPKELAQVVMEAVQSNPSSSSKEALLDRLLATVGEGEIDMLVGMLGQRDQELAKGLKEQYDARKA